MSGSQHGSDAADDLPLGVRIRLGLSVRRVTPSGSATRRLLQKVDLQALDQVVGGEVG